MLNHCGSGAALFAELAVSEPPTCSYAAVRPVITNFSDCSFIRAISRIRG